MIPATAAYSMYSCLIELLFEKSLRPEHISMWHSNAYHDAISIQSQWMQSQSMQCLSPACEGEITLRGK